MGHVPPFVFSLCSLNLLYFHFWRGGGGTSVKKGKLCVKVWEHVIPSTFYRTFINTSDSFAIPIGGERVTGCV